MARLAEAGQLRLEPRHVLAERRDPARIDAVEDVAARALRQPGREDGNHRSGGLGGSGALCILSRQADRRPPSLAGGHTCTPPPPPLPCSWRAACRWCW